MTVISELPSFVLGGTVKVHAPEGTVFITINDDGTIFIRVGKAGSPVNALAEGLARVIHYACGLHPDSLEAIADELSNIAHDRTSTQYEAVSVPDAVAKAIYGYLDAK